MESELYREIFGEGEAKGEASSILAVLAARDIPVSDALRERILTCTDIAVLDTWIRRAVVATTAAAVVRAPRPPVSMGAPPGSAPGSAPKPPGGAARTRRHPRAT